MKRFFFIGSIFYLFYSFPLLAEQAETSTISVVDSHNCNRLSDPQAPFMLALKQGEKIPDAILKCANAAHITSASLSGLGVVENPTIGYFSMKNKDYQFKRFTGAFEVASLNGDLSLLNNSIFPHIHVVLSSSNYKTIGGHLKEATTGAALELTIIPFKNSLIRKDTGETIKPISTE